MVEVFLLNLIVCFLIAGASGWVTRQNLKTWYPRLRKPSFNPPGWIFGPVWSVLYLIISIIGTVLWENRIEHPAPFFLYLVQLLLNFSWSFVFFGARRIDWALVNILLLWLSISCMIFYSFSFSFLVACLTLPYWLWVSFAVILNATLWKLNSKNSKSQ